MLQNQYVREMRKYGVRGLRYDAAKHSKHEQIERSITPPLKNYNERLHNTNLFNPKYGNDSNLLIVFYVQIMPDDFVMQLHRF